MPSELTIWINPGQEVRYCPYCHGRSVRPCEVGGLWTCEDCERDFIVRHRKPQLNAKPRGMRPAELHALLARASSL